MDEPNIHDHETRITVIERQCESCPSMFAKISDKLDSIGKDVKNLELVNAKNSGVKSVIWSFVGGGGVVGIIKAIGYLVTGKQ